MTTKFKKDRFRSRRGGTSRWVILRCGACNTDLFAYQKDGVGQLLRIYLDRIVETPSGEIPFKNLGIKEVAPMKCKNCGVVLCSPMVYGKFAEKRVAQRLVNNGVRLQKIEQHNIDKICIDPAKNIVM